jgi:hypothetical protein
MFDARMTAGTTQIANIAGVEGVFVGMTSENSFSALEFSPVFEYI